MTKVSTYKTKLKRRQEERTDYAKRLALLKPGKPRFVVRKSGRCISVQVIKYRPEGDVTVAAANSRELGKFGWKLHKGSLPAAYLTGLLCGARAAKSGILEAIVDIGLNTPVHKSGVFAAVKGGIDSGIRMPASPEVLPDEGRISGNHIAAYASMLGAEAGKKFSANAKAGANPANAPEYFNAAKNSIIKELISKDKNKETKLSFDSYQKTIKVSKLRSFDISAKHAGKQYGDAGTAAETQKKKGG